MFASAMLLRLALIVIGNFVALRVDSLESATHWSAERAARDDAVAEVTVDTDAVAP